MRCFMQQSPVVAGLGRELRTIRQLDQVRAGRIDGPVTSMLQTAAQRSLYPLRQIRNRLWLGSGRVRAMELIAERR